MNEMTNSQILVQEFEYREPTSLGEAISLLKEYGERAQALAGGTNLLVWMKMEQKSRGLLVGTYFQLATGALL